MVGGEKRVSGDWLRRGTTSCQERCRKRGGSMKEGGSLFAALEGVS